MKKKHASKPAVKAEKKNSPAGSSVPAAGKGEGGVTPSCSDVYSRHIRLSGELSCSFKVEAARCLDGHRIAEPIELVSCESITGGDCDQSCNLSVAEARLFRDAFANAVAFVEGSPMPVGTGEAVTLSRMMAEMLMDEFFDGMESVCLDGGATDYAGRYKHCLDFAVIGKTVDDDDAEDIIKYARLIHELAGRMGLEGFPEPENYVREARRKLKGAGSAGAHGKAGK
jgi:hypothetical protein